MRSIINGKDKYVILAIALFLLFNVLTVANVLGTIIEEKSNFNLDKEDPLGPEGYGIVIPSPNTISALFVDGSNQGKFTITDWRGNVGAEEIVNYPGEDIALNYPLSLDSFFPESFSNVEAIDPWGDISWLNVSAYYAEAETLSPFSVDSVFDYYVMGGGSLNAPFKYDRPMQIDVIVKNPGPKVLKFDWLTDNPSAVTYSNYLISPSGKEVNYYEETANTQGVDLFNYLIFTANEVGSYRLIVTATYSNPASLYLEFLNTDISSLTLNSVGFGGNSDGLLTIEPGSSANWQSNWFKISGNKGDIYRLDLYTDYETGPDVPTIDIWTPSQNGYLLDQGISVGNHEIYFPDSGAMYISFTDTTFGDWYRYSLLVTKAENVNYVLGETLTTYSISMDEIKAIWFTLQKDSIVRFNYTSWLNPLGQPTLTALGTPFGFIFRDSKELERFDINTNFLTRTIDSTDFYWHYMPKGTYKAIIKNTDSLEEGIFQISSKVYEWSDETVPINDLTYPTTSPTEFVTIEFQPDSEFGSLKDPVGINIEIPDIGQFRLNTTMWLSNNTGAMATSTPSYIYSYNDTDSGYYSYGYPQPVFSLDGDSTANDFLYIGAPTIWTGMTFDFSVLGAGGTMTSYVYNGGWTVLSEDNDGTSELTTDGTIEFDVTDNDFNGWERGTGGIDIDPNITETDYFWMRLDCIGDYSGGTVPVLQELTLLNTTILGDLQFILIGDSGYVYDDYWGPGGITQPTDITNLAVSLDDDINVPDVYDSTDSLIIGGGDPNTVGFEAGTYKLLIIPEQWSYPGSVTIQFGVENYWDYAHRATYNINDLTPNPNLHAIDITNYTFAGYSNINGSIYNYGLTAEYNHTESELPFGGGESYFVLECYGDLYQWTQLVATVHGLGTGDYDLFLLQDLPWIGTGGPNGEEQFLLPTNVDYNTTYEFGVFSDHFILLFEVLSSEDNVTFYLSLSQYDTVPLITSDLRASYTPPLDPALVITLAIVIPSATGAVIVVYILKKKGRILTKRPK